MIEGKVKLGKKTKDLVKKIQPGQIAVIDHKDLDQIAGKSLVEKKVKAVINVNQSISGKYPNKGPSIIVNSGIPLIDNCDDLFSSLNNDEKVCIKKGVIYKKGKKIGKGNLLTSKKINIQLKNARANLNNELSKFIDNTLTYAYREKDLILDLPIPDIGVDFKGKHALIVVRGLDYKEDLDAVKTYIREMHPVIIAVDGGADTCLEQGYVPDIIIGDMDSITDNALHCNSQLIVHAYPDGRAPGLKRLESLDLKAKLFPAPGTSEDIAMLLAYEKGAELITAVGTHTNMIDFLEKGRAGMASTLLVRLKIGNKLVDAKGVSKLYKSTIHYHYWIQILLAILLPTAIVAIFSPSLQNFFELLVLKLSLIFSF